MAVMKPDEPPVLGGGTESENDFWYELRDQLSDEFRVYYGLPYLTCDGRQGEVDFLVAHRRLGLLNIECKGGGVHRTGDGKWYRLEDGRRRRLDKTPMEQARGQLEDIVDELAKPARRALNGSLGRFPLVYGWALAFPYTRFDDELPPGLKPEVLIDGSDVSRLNEAVEEAMNFHRRKFGDRRRRSLQLSADAFDVLDTVISPTVDMPALLSTQIERESRQIERISERQLGVIRGLMNNDRFRVTGGAGTGKTVLALHAARLLAAEGCDVLLTCFNVKLAEFLGESVDAWPPVAGEIDVAHFHGLCAEAARKLGDELDYPGREASKEVRDEFWQQKAPFALLRALDEGASVGPWDAIIVDEAQDFASNWWEILEEGLCDGGKMALFYDEHQALFEHGANLPDWGAEYALVENFRNTRAISKAVTKLVDTELEPHRDVPKGEPPSVRQQPGPSKTRRQVGELIDNLVETQRVARDEIAILTPHRPEHSALERRGELGGQPVVYHLSEWSDGDGVLHTTIAGFKGLQAEVIILVDVDPDDPRCSANARYVAGSRAIHRLYVFEEDHWLG